MIGEDSTVEILSLLRVHHTASHHPSHFSHCSGKTDRHNSKEKLINGDSFIHTHSPTFTNLNPQKTHFFSLSLSFTKPQNPVQLRHLHKLQTQRFFSFFCIHRTQRLHSQRNLPSSRSWTRITQAMNPRFLWTLYKSITYWKCFSYCCYCCCFRVEEVGYVRPTDVQKQALPLLFSGRDCILHAQVKSQSQSLALKLILHLIHKFSCFLFFISQNVCTAHAAGVCTPVIPEIVQCITQRVLQ